MDDVYTIDFSKDDIPLCKHSMWVIVDEWDNHDFVCRKYNCFCCANYKCADYEPRGERQGDNG